MKRIKAFLHSLSILQRILLLAALGMVALIVSTRYVGDLMVKDATQHIYSKHQTMTRVAARLLDEGFKDAFTDLLITANGLTQNSNSHSFERSLKFLAREVHHFSGGILFISSNGELISAEPGDASRFFPSVMAKTSLVRNLQDNTGSPGATMAFADPDDGTPAAALYVPAYSSNGAYLGLLVGIWKGESSRLTMILKELGKWSSTGHAELLGIDGMIISATEDSDEVRPSEHLKAFMPALVSGRTMIAAVPYEEHGTGGAERHLMALQRLPSTGWFLALGGNEDEEMSYVWTLQKRIQWFTLSFLVIFSGLGLLTAWKLVQPIKKLTRAARQAATGEVTFKIQEGGEIGELASSLENTRIRLRALLDEIKERNETLEERVRQRTGEVQQQNRELSATAAVVNSISSFLHIQPVLSTALHKVAEILELEAAAIYLKNKTDGKLRLEAHVGLPEELSSGGESVICEKNFCRLFDEGFQPVVVDKRTESCSFSYCPLLTFDSVTSVPISSRKGILGYMCVFSSSHRALSSQDLRILSIIGQQISVAIENAQLYEELEEREVSIHRLLKKVIAAQEDERKRLARELHDETGQTLTALGMSVEALERRVPSNVEVMRENLHGCLGLVNQALQELRKMIFDLRPTTLDDLGLVPALRRYAAQHLESGGITVEFNVTSMLDREEGFIETALFRILQEAINNVARHSKARHVFITLEHQNSHIRGVVEDDGEGFDMSNIRAGESDSMGRGLGLMGMQERASLVGGSVQVTSHPGQGTKITVEIPLKREK